MLYYYKNKYNSIFKILLIFIKYIKISIKVTSLYK